MLSAGKRSLTAQSSNGPCGLRCVDSVHSSNRVSLPDSVRFQSAHGIYSDEAHSDLKKVLKACKALKSLQGAGLLSGYASSLRSFALANPWI